MKTGGSVPDSRPGGADDGARRPRDGDTDGPAATRPGGGGGGRGIGRPAPPGDPRGPPAKRRRRDNSRMTVPIRRSDCCSDDDEGGYGGGRPEEDGDGEIPVGDLPEEVRREKEGCMPGVYFRSIENIHTDV